MPITMNKIFNGSKLVIFKSLLKYRKNVLHIKSNGSEDIALRR